jgi:hypothetical protein
VKPPSHGAAPGAGRERPAGRACGRWRATAASGARTERAAARRPPGAEAHPWYAQRVPPGRAAATVPSGSGTGASKVTPARAVRHVEAFCRRVPEGLEAVTFERKRQLLDLLIDRMVVTDEDVKIRYAVPTSPAGELTRFAHLPLAYCRALPRDLQPHVPNAIVELRLTVQVPFTPTTRPFAPRRRRGEWPMTAVPAPARHPAGHPGSPRGGTRDAEPFALERAWPAGAAGGEAGRVGGRAGAGWPAAHAGGLPALAADCCRRTPGRSPWLYAGSVALAHSWCCLWPRFETLVAGPPGRRGGWSAGAPTGSPAPA